MLGKLSGDVRGFEKSALRIRKFAGLSSYCARLEPYDLAVKLGMRVIEMKELPDVTDQIARTLLLEKSGEWSGASSGKLPDGSVLIVLNATQSYLRRKATLMEEICHVLLGHQRNRLSSDLLGSRDYNKKDEAEAYAVGAAALVPFAGLWHFARQKLQSLEMIARHYDVTTALVKYRAQVTEIRPRNT